MRTLIFFQTSYSFCLKPCPRKEYKIGLTAEFDQMRLETTVLRCEKIVELTCYKHVRRLNKDRGPVLLHNKLDENVITLLWRRYLLLPRR